MFYLYHVNTFVFHEIKDQIIIGRTTGELVFNEDNNMSGKHAQVTLDSQNSSSLMIEDLGSKNLTIVNRVQIPSLTPTKLNVHSVIEIGAQQFIVTDSNTMTLESLNSILETSKYRPVGNPLKDKTHTNLNLKPIQIPESFENRIAAKEKQLIDGASELKLFEEKTLQELAKIDNLKEKLLHQLKTKKLENAKLSLSLEKDIELLKEEAQKIRQEFEIKKKKVINLKDIVD